MWTEAVSATPRRQLLPAVSAPPELAPIEPTRQRPIGRLRVPLAGPYRPWARLYRLPDGRLLWCLRLWEECRPVPHVVSTGTLLAFARLNRLPDLARRIRALVRRAVPDLDRSH